MLLGANWVPIFLFMTYLLRGRLLVALADILNKGPMETPEAMWESPLDTQSAGRGYKPIGHTIHLRENFIFVP